MLFLDQKTIDKLMEHRGEVVKVSGVYGDQQYTREVELFEVTPDIIFGIGGFSAYFNYDGIGGPDRIEWIECGDERIYSYQNHIEDCICKKGCKN